MIRYIKSLCSHKKILRKNISFFAIWDRESSFGRRTLLGRGVKLYKSHVGDFSYIFADTTLVNAKIGKYTEVAADCCIGLGGHPFRHLSINSIFYRRRFRDINWDSPTDYDETPRVTIGNDVWIGARVIVMSGVKIGNGAIVAAGAIVTKDVPDYAIVAGVPAKVVKYRFDEPIVKRLLEIKWWDLSEDQITKHLEGFSDKELTMDILDTFFPRQ